VIAHIHRLPTNLTASTFQVEAEAKMLPAGILSK
jgi:hypothetical protein